MHSKRIVIAILMGLFVGTTWAENTPPASTSTPVEEKSTTQADSTSTSAPQADVSVGDIDAPVFE